MHNEYGVFLGLDVGKSDHHAVALDPTGKRLHDAALPNTEAGLRKLFDKLARHGRILAVVDQPASIGALPVAVARACGHQVAYLPGLVMRRLADLHPGTAKTDARDAYVIADAARTLPHTLRRVDTGDDTLAELEVLVGYDDDLAGEVTRISNRIRGLLTQIHPPLERVLGPKVQHAAVLELLSRCGGPAGLRKAGRTKLVELVKPRAPRMGTRLVEQIYTALHAQTVVVPGTAAAETILPRLADSLRELLQQREQVAAQVEGMLDAHPLSSVLISMPGVGVRTAARILLEVGDVASFPTSGHLAAYAGLAPVTRRSGTSIRGEHCACRKCHPCRWWAPYASTWPTRRPRPSGSERSGAGWSLVLLRLAYLTVTNAFAVLRLLPVGDRNKDVEILALRHQITVLERQLGGDRVKFAPEDRAFLAALLASLPGHLLRRLRLLVRPDTVLRWHRDLMHQRHARTCRPRRPGRPPTVRSIRVLVLRLVRENPSWGYRRVHGELATLGIKIAASTVWEILKADGIDPAPERSVMTWADFLRSQAEALLACDFIETVTLTGQRQYILAVIEHANRRIRILGTTAHPTAGWVTQAIKNLLMDLDDAGSQARYLIRDRDGKFPTLIGEALSDAGIQTVLCGVQVPRMNAIMERWVQSCRHELLDRTLIWNERHLRHALCQYEKFYNAHRAHQAMMQAAPLRAVPTPIADRRRVAHLDIRRRDRLGGVLHEYQHAA